MYAQFVHIGTFKKMEDGILYNSGFPQGEIGFGLNKEQNKRNIKGQKEKNV